MNSFGLPPGIRFNDFLFSEPTPLDGWASPQFTGLYVILAADPNWAPKAFQPLCFGEFGNATPPQDFFRDSAHVVKDQRSLFIAVLALPFSTTSQRWALCQELVRAYHPSRQSDAPSFLPSAAAESKPAPRRPIGFVPLTGTA